MLICDNGIIREMTPEEEEIANNMPNPNDVLSKDEAYDILVGDAND